ncbi:unnamed protein product, partial [Meganyctiphanes norvegica]
QDPKCMITFSVVLPTPGVGFWDHLLACFGLDIRIIFFCFCFLSCLVDLLNTIDTDFHGPKCRIAFSVDLPTLSIWGLFFSVTFLKKVGSSKKQSSPSFINRF